jgi:hypothetical protein
MTVLCIFTFAASDVAGKGASVASSRVSRVLATEGLEECRRSPNSASAAAAIILCVVADCCIVGGL